MLRNRSLIVNKLYLQFAPDIIKGTRVTATVLLQATVLGVRGTRCRVPVPLQPLNHYYSVRVSLRSMLCHPSSGTSPSFSRELTGARANELTSLIAAVANLTAEQSSTGTEYRCRLLPLKGIPAALAKLTWLTRFNHIFIDYYP